MGRHEGVTQQHGGAELWDLSSRPAMVMLLLLRRQLLQAQVISHAALSSLCRSRGILNGALHPRLYPCTMTQLPMLLRGGLVLR